MKARLAPFLVLLEARYAPLLFAVAPQSYAVYLWLWRGSDGADASFWFAVMGALGYELVYVGAIAWAEEGRSSLWTWLTAAVALLFSVAVAYYVYREQGVWAWLHAGFPLVAFCYTLNMHTARPQAIGASVVAPAESVPSALPGGTRTALEALPERFQSTEDPDRGFQVAALPLSAPVAPVAMVVTNGHKPTSAALGATATLLATEASPFRCPHCGEALRSKQALGAAVKNGHCPACRPGR